MLLIKTLSIHSVFLLFAISLKEVFRSILQSFANVIRKHLYWCSSLKNREYKFSRKDFIKVSFLWNLWNFSEQLFTRTTFDEYFCFGVGPAQLCQSNKYLNRLTKQINTLRSNQSYFVKQLPPQKKSRNIQQQLCPWWSPVIIKSQVKLAEAGVHIFMEYFQFRQSITL